MANTRPIIILALMLLMLLGNFMACLSKESTQNITTDQISLLELKSHIIDDPQNLLKINWTTSSSVCNWIGVTCGPKHHRVTALDLSNMGLTGTIPPHFGNLSFLVRLNISHNHFHGSFPVKFANLGRLKFIDLSTNNFNGEIPSWFGSFTDLESLYLGGNNFKGFIPSSLCNLSRLEFLSLYQNDLMGQIPEAIGKLPSLKGLSLAGNQLSGSIPPSIFNISSLETIILTGNMLSGSLPIISLPLNWSSVRIIDFGFNNLNGHLLSNMFEHLPKLQGLYLSRNLITGKIPLSLFKCKELENLSLSLNLLEGTLPKEIGNLTMLKRLYLGTNNLQGEIPQQIGDLINLEILSLRRSKLTGCIPPTMGKLTLIREVDFSSNYLTGHIPSTIGNLTLLRELDFSYNHLMGTMPFQNGDLPNNLERLILHVNSLSGPIPPAIFNSSSLVAISLTSNRLSGHLPSSTGLQLPNLEGFTIAINEVAGSIPISIFNASQLTKLDLGSNFFSGYVPDTLGNLRNLEWFSIIDNNLTVDLSVLISSLMNCKNLTNLVFGGNQLMGTHELPSSIGNLSTSLERFYAGDCGIKGRIPGEIGNLSNLIHLHLVNTELSGPIPTTMGRLRKLQRLYLTGNNLQGSMPYELCNLKRLSDLVLLDNKLSGPIPSCLGDLISLRNLLLGSNRFTSSIPSALMRLTNILQLNLSLNSLSGFLPIDIGNLKVMTSMDLSRNQLSGDIPVSFGDLENLVYLSVSGNKLQSSIPQSFGDLLSLEFLDLSENNLFGVIPGSLEKLLLLKHFNVSFNRLEGEIPSGGPFLNFSIQSFLGNKALCGAPRLQIPPCKSHRATKHLKYFLPTILGPTIFLIIALIIIFLRRIKRNKKQPADVENLLALPAWRRISYLELSKATDGFCESNLLGVGSFGLVYHGTLLDGMSIAVKVFKVEIERAFTSFEVECEVLRHIRHRSLVKIISTCCNLDFKALVLEFMPNGSLEKWLYSHNHFLDILQRLNIMVDVASALEYLHHGHTTSVVHSDLKPSNVLLDEDMGAHLSDFGIAKLLSEEDSMIQTMTLATIGYMAPEYGGEGIISIKSDVYSFGILLMETFTRKKPIDEMFSDKMSLKEWVKQCLPSALIQVVDTNLLSSRGRELLAAKDCLMSILQLGGECCADLPQDRIDMKNVVVKLKKIKIKFLKDIDRVR